MLLSRRIESWQAAHPRTRQSLAELAAVMLEATRASIEHICALLHWQRRIGRSGKPYRYYPRPERIRRP